MKRLFYFLLDVQVARSGGTVHQACPHGRQIYMAKFAMLFHCKKGGIQPASSSSVKRGRKCRIYSRENNH